MQNYQVKEIDIMENRVKGTVKWFSAGRGYGFITDKEGVDYFVHFSQIQQEGFKKLSSGQSVEFTVGEDGNGRKLAREITPLEKREVKKE